MKLPRDFLKLAGADFIARSAYQMGKTPLLPVFAMSLGATDLFLGLIVSVSTLTGLLLKPLVGVLSDRQGRRAWLLCGTALFVLMPFLYRLVSSPEQLMLIRVIHGLATAIYGPVTLACIAEMKAGGVAERLGWFGMARSGGYIVGPALAGWLLLSHDPVEVYTLVGLTSALAFLPVLKLGSGRLPQQSRHVTLLQQMRASLLVAARSPGIWLAGSLELALFVALYTLKIWLPLHALAAGTNIALVGLFFAVQEAAHLLARPAGGRIADRLGYARAICAGMVLMAAGLGMVTALEGVSLLAPALITGLAQALVFPATLGLVTQQMRSDNLGAAMGFVGMMQNLGKVLGPVAGGLLIAVTGYEALLLLLAAALLASALAPALLAMMYRHRSSAGRRTGRRHEAGSHSVAEGHSQALPT